tara:strand:+ start:1066 stop:1506 length:441 start_codon:yes stop_codon:yes gene_type:complete
MPCEQCEEGLYKWGENGECMYETLEDCQLANQEEYLEETLKPKYEEEIDWTYNFTSAQMKELHDDGKLIVKVEKEEQESMTLLFTYDREEKEDDREEELEEDKREDDKRIDKEEKEEREYAKLTVAMLDGELDEYIDKLTASIKKL